MSNGAIEICTERAFNTLFIYKDIEYIYEAVIDQKWRYNRIVMNERAKKIYEALSGKTFNKNSKMWKDLETHFKNRDKVAHKAVEFKKEEAELSLEVAKKFIKNIHDTLEHLRPKN